MLMIPVKSSNISAAGYEDGKIRIQFSNGTEYDYEGGAELFNDMLESKSVGKFFHQNIKGKVQGVKRESGDSGNGRTL